jgi:hypothetical protein
MITREYAEEHIGKIVNIQTQFYCADDRRVDRVTDTKVFCTSMKTAEQFQEEYDLDKIEFVA